MDEELGAMFQKLKFSKIEQERVIYRSSITMDLKGYDAWAMGKIMA